MNSRSHDSLQIGVVNKYCNSELEFAEDHDQVLWPVEHPSEPLDEDRPVKCPIPTSSFTAPLHHVEGRRSLQCHRRSVDSLRKRCTKNPARPTTLARTDDGLVLELAEADRNRAVRKRHHTISQQPVTHATDDQHQYYYRHPSEDVLRRMSSLPPNNNSNNNNNCTVFHMLQRASP
ncbi:hypothetical protein LINPERPRIM_LOCUS23021 [Linum perenne]